MGNKIDKVLISPWGDPTYWIKQEYKFKNRSISSYNSLEILIKELDPKKTLILSLDTLAKNGKEYNEVVSETKEIISDFIKEKLDIKDYNYSERLEILVLPGVGKFMHGSFIGEVMDYYHYLIFKLVNLFFNWKLFDTENEENLEFHLDLTYGINYSTVLTYRALNELLETFSIFKKITLFAYSTDPVGRGVKRGRTINIVEHKKITPSPPNQKMSSNKKFIEINGKRNNKGKTKESNLDSRITINNENELIREAYKQLEKVNSLENMNLSKNRISNFLGSIYNGLPLGIYQYYPPHGKLQHKLKEIIEKYTEGIKIKREGEKIILNRTFKIGNDFKPLLMAYIISSLLNEQKEIENKNEVSLHELMKFQEFFNFDERLISRIDRDLNNIKKRSHNEEDIRNRWVPYSELFKKRKKDQVDKRNFLAHSGLEMNIIELMKRDDNEILLKYSSMINEEINNYFTNGLREF